MDKVQDPNDILSGYMFWRIPNFERMTNPESFSNSILFALSKYKSLYPEYYAKNNDLGNYAHIARQFLLNFFMHSINEPVECFISNISNKFEDDARFFCIRIPAHPLFNLLPNTVALTVIGCFNQLSDTPFFRPMRVSISFGQNSPAPYEQKAKLNFVFLEAFEFPPSSGERYLKNFLTNPALTALPPFVLESSQRFSEWSDFLEFKENLVKQKTQGLRYLIWRYNQDDGNLEFLVVSPDESYLKKNLANMKRQSIHAFKLGISSDPFIFSLPQNSNMEKERIFSSFADLGQLAPNCLSLLKDNKDESFMQVLNEIDTKGSKINIKKACYALLKIEPSESLAYNLSQINFDYDPSDHESEAEAEPNNYSPKNQLKKIFKNLPEQGFLSISLIGDLALIARHKRALKNLFSNESCYAPYLANYLFNITTAQVPESLCQIDQWFNEDLNDNQKLAVRKMLSAPNIALIQGPPGTGKTTVIAEACLQFVQRNERVLIASQSHDALDNALSRLKNHPQLRVIRLAHAQNRITDGGKEFTGAAVLAKQYVALKSLVAKNYLNHKIQLEIGIDKLSALLNDADFLLDDVGVLNAQLTKAHQQLNEYAHQISVLEQEQRQERYFDFKLNEQSNLAQFLEQAISSCQNLINYEKVDLNLLLAGEPFIANLANLAWSNQVWFNDLASALLKLESLKIELVVTQEQFFNSPHEQGAMFIELYSQFTQVNHACANMLLDLKNLELNNFTLSTSTVDYDNQIKELDEQLAALKLELLQANELNEAKLALLQNIVAKRNRLALSYSDSSKHSHFQFYDYALFVDYELLQTTNDPNTAKAWLNEHINSIIQFNESLLLVLKSAYQMCCDHSNEYQNSLDKLKANTASLAHYQALNKEAKLQIAELENQVNIRLQGQINLFIKLKQILVALALDTNKPHQVLSTEEQNKLLSSLPLEPLTKQIMSDLTVQQNHLTNKTFCTLVSHDQTYELNYESLSSLCAENHRFLQYLQDELALLPDKAKGLAPLYEKWDHILSSPVSRALSDWEYLDETYIASCNVVAISCNENERTLTNNHFDGFDVVIIDEVSKATPLELLLPLMRAPKAILVGDHRQLPPIFNEAEGISLEESMDNDENEELSNTAVTKANLNRFERMVTASLYKELYEKAPDSLRQLLDIQYRMHPSIMNMINPFYEGALKCGNPELKREHKLSFTSPSGNTLLSPNDHVLWVDTYLDTQDKNYSIPLDRNINPVEAKLIARTLVDIDEQCAHQGYGPHNKLKIGVVSFYQPQCRTIRQEIAKLLKRHKNWFKNIDVEINTVIRFQGKEKPVIILSLVKNNGKSPNQSFKKSKANIARFEFVNVAMSRAQNLLMVFGARNMLNNLEVRLPRMDSTGYDFKKVYKSIFDCFEFSDNYGHMTTSAEFSRTLTTPMPTSKKAKK